MSESVEATKQVDNHEGQESIEEPTGSSDSSSEESPGTTRTMQLKGWVNDSHPPGFRSLTVHIEKYTSCQGDDYFEL